MNFKRSVQKFRSIRQLGLLATGVFLLVLVSFVVVEFMLGLSMANNRWSKQEYYVGRHLKSYSVYDCTGRFMGMSTRWVRWNEISRSFRDTAIRLEDKTFLQNASVISIRGVMRGVMDLFTTGRLNGGSTITQQAAKNAFDLPVGASLFAKIQRKIAQIILAYRLLNDYDDPKVIFAIWANSLYFGDGIRGLSNASWALYGIPPSSLNTVQSIELFVLWNRPARLLRDRDGFIKRRNYVLSLLHSEGQISDSTYQESLQNVCLDRTSLHTSPPFSGVINAISNEAINQNIDPSEYIQSTIDARYQFCADQASAHVMKKLDTELGLRPYNNASYAERVNYPNMSLIVISRNGSIRALCPNRDFRTSRFDRSLALIELGSTVKPFLASLAFEKGLNPSSRLLDAPLSIRTSSNKIWEVRNFANDYTYRDMTIAYALTLSSNVVFARLVEKLGVTACADQLHAFGLRCPDQLSLAVGAVYDNIRDLADAYLPFIDLGLQPSLRLISNVGGRVMPRPSSRRVLTERAAYLTNVCLQDVVLHGTGEIFNGYTAEIGCKTGTGHNYTRSVCVLLTPNYVIAAMVGFDDSRPLRRKNGTGITGALGAGEIISDFLRLCPDVLRGNFVAPKSGAGYALESNPYTGKFAPGLNNSILLPIYIPNKPEE